MGKTPAPAGSAALVARLRQAGCVYAEEEAALLLAAAGGDDRTLERLAAERLAGRPLEYVLGWAEFCGLRLALSEGVFIPRRRTEFLAGLAVEELGQRPSGVAVDLCCGTGALGAVLAARTSAEELFAVDSDGAAAACARRNLGARAAVFQGDLFDPLPPQLRGRVDLIAANAPYVPTARLGTLPAEARLHEPVATHDGGTDGLAVLSRIAAGATGWLAPSGVLLVECAAGQAEALAEVFARAGLQPGIRHCAEADATVLRGVLAS